MSIKLGNVCFKGFIGEGAYGEVWKVKWKGKIAAGKQLKGHHFDCNQKALDSFLGEYETLRRLSHPNIVRLFGLEIFDEEPPMIIMELMHQDLSTYINDSETEPKVQLKDAISIMLGVAEGLKYLHNFTIPVIHRDLSSKNILLDKNNRAKITDLGQARICPELSLKDATPTPGCLPYVAPETFSSDNPRNPLLRGRANYGPQVDIFSFGVIVLEVVIGKYPRPDDTININSKGES